MNIVHADEVSYQRFSAHRAGMSRHKQLLHGISGAPDNFELSLVLSSSDYGTPNHKHNFDQIRYMLEGAFNYGRKQRQTEGSISYFPEGAAYAQQAEGESITLLLQFGGASGEGFMSYEDLDRGYHDLSQQGCFESGVYSWQDDIGKPHNKDAYEAIWEHIKNRKLNYPKPRYSQPILMDPENYKWIDSGDEVGVELKVCGRFSERDIGAGLIRMGAGAGHRASLRRIYYFLTGSGSIGGHGWRAQTAFHAEGESNLVIQAETASEMIFFDLPDFSKRSN